MVFILILLSSLLCQSLADPPHHHYHHHAHNFNYPNEPGNNPFVHNHGGPQPPQHFPSQTTSSSGETPIVFVPDPGSPDGDIEDKFSFTGSSSRQQKMKVLYSWKVPDFTWPSEQARDDAIRSQRYIPNNTFILDVDVYVRGSEKMVFVTLPRARPGVPVTLATVSQIRRDDANLLAPFPNWPSHTGTCGNVITSVFRTHVDPCGRLWVLDSGNNNVFAGASRIVCSPQILIYDLKNNNNLIGRYHIPDNMVETNSLFVTIAVDTRRRDCSDAYAYIADSIAYKMIVFDLRNQQFWRMNSVLFFPYPDQSRFNVGGVSFDLMGGVFGLALGPVFRGNRRLYFHCIDSVKQSWVDTKDIRNRTLWSTNMNAAPRSFNLFGGSRTSQSAAATMNGEGIMFFGLLGSNEIACWNSQTQFTGRNIPVLAKDDTNLQFNSGIKVYGSKLYAATSRLQNYITARVPTNQENYRVLEGDVPTLTRGTSCQVVSLNRFDEQYEPDSESVEPDLDTSNFGFA